VISWEYTPKDYTIDSEKPLKMAIKIIGIITDPQAVADELAGKFGSLSLGWTTTSWLINPKTNQRIDTGVIINELSLVSNPANLEATYTKVTDADLVRQYQIGKQVDLYGQKATTTHLYQNQKGLYYAQAEFETIQNLKTYIPMSIDNQILSAVKDVLDKNNINYNDVSNNMDTNTIEPITTDEVVTTDQAIEQVKVMDKDKTLNDVVTDDVVTNDVVTDEVKFMDINDSKGVDPSNVIEPELTEDKTAETTEKTYSEDEVNELKAMYDAQIDDLKSQIEQLKQANLTNDVDTDELENVKSQPIDAFDALVNQYGYKTAVKIQKGLILI